MRLLAHALTMAGDSDRAVEAIESAIEVVEPEDRELALLLEAELAAHAQEASLERRAPAARRLERYADLEGATPGERLVLASLAFERARASESASEAAAHLERALAGGRLLGEQEVDVAGPFYLLLVGLLATDALDLAEACLEQALADARARASIPAQAFVIEFRGWVSLRRGAVARAEADARTALELLTAHDIQLGSAFALALLIEALIEEGEVEAAERALQSSGLGDEIPPGMASNDLLEARGLLRLAQGRTREGLDDLLEFGRRDELWGGANPLASRWRSRAALALAALGDGERARRMAPRTSSGRGAGERRAGSASRCAPPRWSRRGRRPSIACARRRRCSRARRHGSSTPARSPTSAPPCGAPTAAPRRAARSRRGSSSPALRRPRARRARPHGAARRRGPRRATRSGAGCEQLTASERRVAELAAEGQSNPEIAQALFVTRKTVETHLGHVYRKLDISGRAELRPGAWAEGNAYDATRFRGARSRSGNQGWTSGSSPMSVAGPRAYGRPDGSPGPYRGGSGPGLRTSPGISTPNGCAPWSSIGKSWPPTADGGRVVVRGRRRRAGDAPAAWRTLERFEGRSSLRSWLYRIATNVCLDMVRAKQRRARPDGSRIVARGRPVRPGRAAGHTLARARPRRPGPVCM